jgi:hypothetical protein
MLYTIECQKQTIQIEMNENEHLDDVEHNLWDYYNIHCSFSDWYVYYEMPSLLSLKLLRKLDHKKSLKRNGINKHDVLVAMDHNQSIYDYFKKALTSEDVKNHEDSEPIDPILTVKDLKMAISFQLPAMSKGNVPEIDLIYKENKVLSEETSLVDLNLTLGDCILVEQKNLEMEDEEEEERDIEMNFPKTSISDEEEEIHSVASEVDQPASKRRTPTNYAKKEVNFADELVEFEHVPPNYHFDDSDDEDEDYLAIATFRRPRKKRNAPKVSKVSKASSSSTTSTKPRVKSPRKGFTSYFSQLKVVNPTAAKHSMPAANLPQSSSSTSFFPKITTNISNISNEIITNNENNNQTTTAFKVLFRGDFSRLQSPDDLVLDIHSMTLNTPAAINASRCSSPYSFAFPRQEFSLILKPQKDVDLSIKDLKQQFNALFVNAQEFHVSFFMKEKIIHLIEDQNSVSGSRAMMKMIQVDENRPLADMLTENNSDDKTTPEELIFYVKLTETLCSRINGIFYRNYPHPKFTATSTVSSADEKQLEENRFNSVKTTSLCCIYPPLMKTIVKRPESIEFIPINSEIILSFHESIVPSTLAAFTGSPLTVFQQKTSRNFAFSPIQPAELSATSGNHSNNPYATPPPHSPAPSIASEVSSSCDYNGANPSRAMTPMNQLRDEFDLQNIEITIESSLSQQKSSQKKETVPLTSFRLVQSTFYFLPELKPLHFYKLMIAYHDAEHVRELVIPFYTILPVKEGDEVDEEEEQDEDEKIVLTTSCASDSPDTDSPVVAIAPKIKKFNPIEDDDPLIYNAFHGMCFPPLQFTSITRRIIVKGQFPTLYLTKNSLKIDSQEIIELPLIFIHANNYTIADIKKKLIRLSKGDFSLENIFLFSEKTREEYNNNERLVELFPENDLIVEVQFQKLLQNYISSVYYMNLVETKILANENQFSPPTSSSSYLAVAQANNGTPAKKRKGRKKKKKTAVAPTDPEEEEETKEETQEEAKEKDDPHCPSPRIPIPAPSFMESPTYEMKKLEFLNDYYLLRHLKDYNVPLLPLDFEFQMIFFNDIHDFIEDIQHISIDLRTADNRSFPIKVEYEKEGNFYSIHFQPEHYLFPDQFYWVEVIYHSKDLLHEQEYYPQLHSFQLMFKTGKHEEEEQPQKRKTRNSEPNGSVITMKKIKMGNGVSEMVSAGYQERKTRSTVISTTTTTTSVPSTSSTSTRSSSSRRSTRNSKKRSYIEQEESDLEEQEYDQFEESGEEHRDSNSEDDEEENTKKNNKKKIKTVAPKKSGRPRKKTKKLEEYEAGSGLDSE